MTRKRDREQTRQELLATARRQFARAGYDGTSVRDVAGAVGVDPALVFRYFGSKRGLFDEAMAAHTDAMIDAPLEQWPRELLGRLVFQDWEEYDGEHPLIVALRSIGSDDERDRLRDEICAAHIDKLADLAGDAKDKQLRAELFAAWMLGLGILRSAVRTPALAKAEQQDLQPHLEAVAEAIFGRPIPGPE
ncbi:TetR/AcrR family transcriptional regulator [Tenggerimyces flavus]|uniref:TetR/AcrR family transcriptional regulator n=1 Tax=Tenggerimyces flavus TaxID=1708749 RepID=A0ABV7YE26_9ACTN|nr:TetR/AcrR family transcriptional regulator [Tenggerimyces flavus]MBM7785956.1 AcrR family transcriptional regulator [Tenggerimyces flavus]